MELLKAYPHMLREGQVPSYLLAKRLKEDFKNIDEMISDPIRDEFVTKTLFPTLNHV